jgi:hypothetical protein
MVQTGTLHVQLGCSRGYHEDFRPGWWLQNDVEAREGTPAAQLDHPLFSGLFSQGARRCPDSRVSKNEAFILFARLVLDWKMSSPIKYWKGGPNVKLAHYTFSWDTLEGIETVK